MKRFMKTAVVATVLVAGIAGVAQASEAVTEYRKENMEIIGSHMHSMVKILKGQVSNSDDLALHAKGLADAATMTAGAFKEESMDGKTEAKKAIWSDWAKFEQAADKLKTESAKMAELAAGGDKSAIGAQLGALGKTCKGCHDDFKEK